MVRVIGWMVLSLALVFGWACGGDDGSDGSGSWNADAVLLGSCTEPPSSSGHYLCMTSWQVPDNEIIDPVAFFRNACGEENTYSAGQCAGGYKGCCTVTDAAGTHRTRYCFYGEDPDDLWPAACDVLDGVWG